MSSSFMFILTNTIQKKPWIIVASLSFILGLILNFIYEIVYSFITANILGFAIMGLTIVTRLLMLPLAFKQQKSMNDMQTLQPEIKKIQDKYKAKDDPEVQKKLNVELQKLYSKHNYNPFSGCLPVFIQIPIFLTLIFVMQNSYLYVNRIGNIYENLSKEIISVSNYEEYVLPLADSLMPKNKNVVVIFSLTNEEIKAINDSPDKENLIKGYGVTSEQFSKAQGMESVINKFTNDDWDTLIKKIKAGGGNTDNIERGLEEKRRDEMFFGVDLVEKVGYKFPNIFIPIMSGVTTFFSSWLMTKKNKPTDPAAASQQKIMTITMPLFMIYITGSISGGVGVYWITSNVFQIVQQLALNKFYDNNKKVVS